MHTATRLALPVVERVRREQPAAHVCCYGLYAPLNATLLRSMGVGTVLGGEFEAALVDSGAAPGRGRAGGPAGLRRPAAAGVPGARPLGPAPARALRVARDGRRAPRGRLHGGLARLQAPVPALPGRARLRRPLPRRAARRRDGGRPRAGRRRGAAHHLRRPRLPQRAPARARRRARVRPRVARRDLRRDDQGRAPARARAAAAGAARDGLRAGDERRRVGGRPRAGAPREGPHPRRRRARGGRVPRGRPRARAHLRAVHALDDERGLRRSGRDRRGARSGRRGRAHPARHPPARAGGLAPARARRRAPARGLVRSAARSRTRGGTPTPGWTGCRSRLSTSSAAGPAPRAPSCSRACARWRTLRPAGRRPAPRPPPRGPAPRCRTSTSPGIVEPSRHRSRWL